MAQAEIIFGLKEAQQSVAALRAIVNALRRRLDGLKSLMTYAAFEERMLWFEPKYNPVFGPEDERYPDLLEEVWLEYRDKGYNGITDPDVIEHILRWQEVGLAGCPDIDIEHLNIIMDRIMGTSDFCIDDERFFNLIDDAGAILFGGYDILGDTDIARFFVAIQYINQNIRDLPVDYIDHDTWMDLMRWC